MRYTSIISPVALGLVSLLLASGTFAQTHVVAEYKCPGTQIGVVVVSPNGTTVAAGCWDASVRLWDVNTKRLVYKLKSQTERITSMQFSPDGKLLASVSFDGSICLWIVGTGKLKHKVPAHWDTPYYSTAFSRDGKLLTAGTQNGLYTEWDIQDFSKPVTINLTDKQMDIFKRVVWSIAVSPDDSLVTAGISDGTIVLVERKGLRRIKHSSTRPIFGVAFRNNGSELVSVSSDNTARLWNVAAGTLKSSFKAKSGLFSVAVNPTNQCISMATYDGSIVVWNPSGANAPVTLEGRQRVFSVAYSPHGEYLISGGKDGILRIWK